MNFPNIRLAGPQRDQSPVAGIGDDVTEGFKATLIQAAAGKINIAVSSSHMIYSNAGGRTRTLNPLDELEVSTFPFGPVYLAFRVRPTA